MISPGRELPLPRRALLVGLNALLFLFGLYLAVGAHARALLAGARLRYFWLKPRPDDIFISTYPKSGTTWAQMILYQLVTGGRGEFEHILQVSPFFEVLPEIPNGEALLDSLPSPRLLKTHLLWRWLRLPAQSKCIYVTRNAYDSIISGYHHARLFSGSDIGLHAYFRANLRGFSPLGSWFTHLKSWWPHRNDPNVLHVRYEDLQRDLEGQIRRIAVFCNLPIEEGAMPRILEKCGFQYMKQNNARFDFRLKRFDRSGPGPEGFIRKGGQGGAEEVPAELKAQLENRVAEVKRELAIGEAEL